MNQLFDSYDYQDVVDIGGDIAGNPLLVEHILVLLAFGWAGFMIVFIKRHAKPRVR